MERLYLQRTAVTAVWDYNILILRQNALRVLPERGVIVPSGNAHEALKGRPLPAAPTLEYPAAPAGSSLLQY